ncbi:MAG: nucleotide exchange factor GrpE [Kiritimatiellia bacterium]
MKSAILAIVAAFAVAVAKADTAENIRQLRGTSVGAIPVRTSCRTVVIDGTNYVQETWRRGNFTWTNLQTERKIIGAKIQNSAEKQIESLAAEITARVSEYASMSNRAARAESFKASFRQRIEEHRDNAITTTAKSFYNELLDVWDEIDAANNAKFGGGQ